MKRIIVITVTVIGMMFLTGNVQAGFIDNGDGTVTDTTTGLMWQQKTCELGWSSAIDYCSNLPLAGYTDWHLPSKNELWFLVDQSKGKPAIDTNFFPDTMSGWYWSSTIKSGSQVWVINFSNGSPLSVYKGGGSSYVRAVRTVNSSGNGGCTQSDLDTQYQEGYQAGINASISGACTQSELNAQYQAGKDYCINDPSACGLTTAGSSSITINTDFSFTIPNATYNNPLNGNMDLSIDFKFFKNQNGTLLWKLDDVTVK